MFVECWNCMFRGTKNRMNLNERHFPLQWNKAVIKFQRGRLPSWSGTLCAVFCRHSNVNQQQMSATEAELMWNPVGGSGCSFSGGLTLSDGFDLGPLMLQPLRRGFEVLSNDHSKHRRHRTTMRRRRNESWLNAIRSIRTHWQTSRAMPSSSIPLASMATAAASERRFLMPHAGVASKRSVRVKLISLLNER